MENEKVDNTVELDTTEPKNKKQKISKNSEEIDDVILLNKPLGWTPLQAIEEYKKHNPERKNQKYGYAGRLDPMARGLLIILGGNAVKKQKEMELTSKEYIFEVHTFLLSLLLGFIWFENGHFRYLGIRSLRRLPNSS